MIIELISLNSMAVASVTKVLVPKEAVATANRAQKTMIFSLQFILQRDSHC